MAAAAFSIPVLPVVPSFLLAEVIPGVSDQ